MPTYDYQCDSNGQRVAVAHKMSEALATWGELCARTGIERGTTPADAPVRRLITGGAVISIGNLGSTERPCDYGSPCGGCACDGE
jgi:predicted nucleic acid-binding Zn ribbon protein